MGAGTVEGRGTVFAYSSEDFLTWDYDGLMLEAAPWDLPGNVWECPDLLVQGERAVLVVSCIGDPVCGIVQPVLWIGGTLDPTDAQQRIVPDSYGLFDLGPRFYAPQSYVTSDGRRLMFGWLREHFEHAVPDGQVSDAQAPGTQAPGTQAPADRERVGIMSLPRELALVDGRPFQTPAREAESARSATPVLEATIHDGAQIAVGLGECFELEITTDGGLGDAGVVLHLAGPGASAGAGADGATFDLDLGALVREPTSWVRTGDTWSPVDRPAAHARVLFDRGVVEVFLDNGSAAAWTPVHLRDVHTVTLGLRDATSAHVTLWTLTRP
jgi:beta-fructofuranosidase